MSKDAHLISGYDVHSKLFYLVFSKSVVMNMKYMVVVLLVTAKITTQAQNNFSYSPEKPKPGEIITFNYEPAGDIANAVLPVEGFVYQMGQRANKTDDISIEKKGVKYTGTISTDTAMNFLYIAFKADKKFDSNSNDGQYILLYENDKPRRGSYNSLNIFYQYAGKQVGLDANNEKALAALQNKVETYPESKPMEIEVILKDRLY